VIQLPSAPIEAGRIINIRFSIYIGTDRLAVRYAVQNSRPVSKVKVKDKGKGYQGQKTKNCRVIPVGNA